VFISYIYKYTAKMPYATKSSILWGKKKHFIFILCQKQELLNGLENDKYGFESPHPMLWCLGGDKETPLKSLVTRIVYCHILYFVYYCF